MPRNPNVQTLTLRVPVSLWEKLKADADQNSMTLNKLVIMRLSEIPPAPGPAITQADIFRIADGVANELERRKAVDP